MARRKSKSERIITDQLRPWDERLQVVHQAVHQIPRTDWKHDALAAFLRVVEEELLGQPSQPVESAQADHS